MNTSGEQIPLSIKLRDQAVFESFFPGANTEIVADLMEFHDTSGSVRWLWGSKAVGKTHLLQAACARNERAAYLPGCEIKNSAPDILRGYENYGLVCIDDVEQLIGDRQWEGSLFSLFNELVTERQRNLVIASSQSPRSTEFCLADLRSRLLSGPVYHLEELSDNDRMLAIQLRATRRGLDLPDSTAQFLLTHFKRDMHSLCEMLDQLDTASLVHQRRLTIPLVKETLADAG